MSRLPASLRLSFILALLTVSIVILGNYIGVLPNPDRTALDTRAKLVESLAVQFSLMAQRDEYGAIEESMEALVDRNDDVYFAVLRKPDGTELAEAGFSTRTPIESEIEAPVSTSTNVRVPIFRGEEIWATVEIEFSRLNQGGLLAIIAHPLLRLVVFFAVAGFLTYLLFLKRALRDLDPSAVIPERVKTAMDALAEGVLFLDRRGRIVLANRAFVEKMGQPAESLLGLEVSKLPWSQSRADEEHHPVRLPWTGVLRDGRSRMGVAINVTAAEGEVLTFAANCAPITDPRGAVRGALVTFDDLTELQRKNEDLEDTLEMLQASQEQIKDQNKKLEFLATRDPLTLCLNRRSFIERFASAFESAAEHGNELCCIMVDIDHFKAVNDRHGHATGDQVISLMGQTLTGAVRGDDLVCRYGGEEFCVVLPETEGKQAKAICERIRESLPGRAWEKEILPGSAKLTASFGLTMMSLGAATPEELLDQADKALYAAKDHGRNRVIGWDEPEARHAPPEEPAPEVTVEVGAPEVHSLLESESPAPQAEEAVEETEADLVEAELIEAELIEAELIEAELSRDEVTGLPDRAAFKQAITQAAQRVRGEGKLALVLLLELRMFRRVSVSLGTTGTEQVLREVGCRLDRALRATDSVVRLEEGLVARYGFDKFGIVLRRVTSLDSATGAIKRLLDVLSERLDVDGQAVNVTCNIGISVCPHDDDGPRGLLERAQIALQYAKRHGATGYRFYQGYMNTTSVLELGLERELRRALSSGQLRLTYQPIAELEQGTIAAMEALLRWEHPGLGLLQPGQFIGAAEREGLMVPMGRWALEEACTEGALWLESGAPDVKVSVNVSATQLRSQTFQSDVIGLLDRSGLPPSALQLELNEAALVKDLSAAIDSVAELRARGVKIGVDDVGARSIALDYLKRLSPDVIKVDRSLVKGASSSSVTGDKLRSIAKIAHGLEAKMAAVGVETDEQLELLQALGCDLVQGYLLCPPLAPARARELIDRGRSLLAPPPPNIPSTDALAEAG